MLNEIRERWAKATPGNWSWVIKGNSVQSHAVICHNDAVSLVPQNICSGISPKTGNAPAIAHAPADVAYLLEMVEKLKCCGNCKHNHFDWEHTCQLDIGKYIEPNYKCDRWEADHHD